MEREKWSGGKWNEKSGVRIVWCEKWGEENVARKVGRGKWGRKKWSREKWDKKKRARKVGL